MLKILKNVKSFRNFFLSLMNIDWQWFWSFFFVVLRKCFSTTVWFLDHLVTAVIFGVINSWVYLVLAAAEIVFLNRILFESTLPNLNSLLCFVYDASFLFIIVSVFALVLLLRMILLYDLPYHPSDYSLTGNEPFFWPLIRSLLDGSNLFCVGVCFLWGGLAPSAVFYTDELLETVLERLFFSYGEHCGARTGGKMWSATKFLNKVAADKGQDWSYYVFLVNSFGIMRQSDTISLLLYKWDERAINGRFIEHPLADLILSNAARVRQEPANILLMQQVVDTPKMLWSLELINDASYRNQNLRSFPGEERRWELCVTISDELTSLYERSCTEDGREVAVLKLEHWVGRLREFDQHARDRVNKKNFLDTIQDLQNLNLQASTAQQPVPQQPAVVAEVLPVQQPVPQQPAVVTTTISPHCGFTKSVYYDDMMKKKSTFSFNTRFEPQEFNKWWYTRKLILIHQCTDNAVEPFNNNVRSQQMLSNRVLPLPPKVW